MLTRFSKASSIPSSKSMSTKKSSPTTTNYAAGIYTYKPNDTMDYDEIYVAQNARFDRIGEYRTRYGMRRQNELINQTTVDDNYSNSYVMKPAEDVQIYTCSTTGNITTVDLTVVATNSTDYGHFELALLNSSNEVVGKCCTDLTTTTPTSMTFFFKDAPTGPLKLVCGSQRGSKQKFLVATVNNVLMHRIKVAEMGEIISMYETNINSVKTLLVVFKDTSGVSKLYRYYNNSFNLIRQLPSGVTKVRFLQTQDKIRYADGKEGPHLIDPSNNWTDTAIATVDLETGVDLGIKVSNILAGTEDNILYFDADTTTQAVWTYPYGYIHSGSSINSYDKFDRDFRQNFPAINTGDPLTAMFNLGGILYFLTRKHKYYLYSQTADVWTQDTSPAQHGTFSQESVVCDLNYAYFASDDGIYIFDGSSESSLTENTIQNTYDAIKGKESIRVELHNNRLYVFYSSTGNGKNDSALVYNINLRLWESFDTGLPVSAIIARQNASNRFWCGSNKTLAIYSYEYPQDVRYADAGAPIDFDLQTAYLHFGTPSQYHRITKWRPEFATTTGDYSVACGYAIDFSNEVRYAFSVDLKRNTTVFDDSYIWDNIRDYGVNIVPTVLSTIPKVYEQFRRIQFRYQHHAAYEPVNLKAVTVSVQTQRLR